MKLAWTLGIAAAVFLHAAFLLFGGIFLPDPDGDLSALTSVDLLSALEAEKEDEKKLEEPKEPDPEELETEKEEPPDAAEILRNLEAPPTDDSPALEAASLSAIEAALNGQGGGGDFADALSFASGGTIGGTGQAGTLNESMEQAFNPADLDQPARPIYQVSPVIPSEMRGKQVEGVVTVIFVVDSTGKVENPRVEKSTHTAFELPALNAIRRWKFEPGIRGGERVASKRRISIRFPPS